MISAVGVSKWELSDTTEEGISAAVMKAKQNQWDQHWENPQPLYTFST